MPKASNNGDSDDEFLKFLTPKLATKEQEKALGALYQDSRLRSSLKTLKRIIPVSSSLRDQRVKQVFRNRARLILSAWGLHKFPHHLSSNYKWLVWLWRHWDPDTCIRPVLPSSIREPQLAPWTIHYLEDPANFSHNESHHRLFRNAWVTVTFFPGISHGQAMKAAQAAYLLANKSLKGKTIPKLIGGRPAALDTEVITLIGVFEQVGLPAKIQGQRQADKLRRIRKIIDDSSEQPFDSLRQWSLSTIANHYRKWRASQGAPPRRYHKETTGH